MHFIDLLDQKSQTCHRLCESDIQLEDLNICSTCFAAMVHKNPERPQQCFISEQRVSLHIYREMNRTNKFIYTNTAQKSISTCSPSIKLDVLFGCKDNFVLVLAIKQ